MDEMIILGQRAQAAAKKLGLVSNEMRNLALIRAADEITAQSNEIIKENKIDIENAQKNGMSEAFIDRLMLNEERIISLAEGLRQVSALPDNIGEIIESFKHKNGMLIEKVCVPLGVIAVIFESRPNVAADSAAICVKSGNAVILRGGSEAIRSNTAIVSALRAAFKENGLPEDSVILMSDTSRESAAKLMKLNGYVNVLIPRGGKGLIQSVLENASVPVIETGAGTCHTYIDSSADIQKAVKIVYNAKTSRPSVCNALECLLVHKDIAEEILPIIADALSPKNVEIRADERALRILGKKAVPAVDSDWGTEYNDYIMAVKVVDDINEALLHIDKYSTKHSECIVTENDENAGRFLREVDAAAVYHNVSTRFTDGGEFGLGAEIGISTQKLHARGPLGPKELTTYKYTIFGNGQTR